MTLPAGTPRYALVAFDFDGTLADTMDWFDGMIEEVCARYGLRTPDREERAALRLHDAREVFRKLGLPLWKVPAVVGFLRGRMAASRPGLALFTGIEDALATLHAAGVRLALLSSNSSENVREVLGPRMWACFSEDACGSDVFGKAGKMRRLLRRQGVPAAQALLVGDELRDIDAAREARVAAGAVTWGYNLPDVLRARQPDLLFETPADLARLILAD
ncbi:hydrolase, haloacid dehalogenase-like family [plant metagenome]|uniref:Hydrolase, haloacid dehalogenase-like family n=1 Tax=plant metagenome TaxID=1297885 RepID=A0A484SKP3_9ZZZZ